MHPNYERNITWTTNGNLSTSHIYQRKRENKLTTEAWNRSKKKKVRSSVNGTKYNSLRVYIRGILESSLITSIPEITKTENRIKKIVKIIVFIMCLIGFIYQTLNFLWLYLSYPTVVNVLVSNPFEVTMPAITICNRNRLRRSTVCSGEDSTCSYMNDTNFCDTYPRSCPTFKKPFTGIPFITSMIQNSWDWEEQKDYSHTVKMIHTCEKFVEGEKILCKKPYRQIPVVTSLGEPNMCYTIESLWGQPDVEPDVYPNTFTLELTVRTEPEEYTVYTEPVLIQIALHDARRLVNPYTEGHSLEGGLQYDAMVTMTEKKLLDPPYDTNCTDYLKMWKKNNGTGPLNDLMCIEYCKLNTLMEMDECIDKNVYYPHVEELCEKGTITTTADIIKNCTNLCGNPCRDYSYEVRYEAVNNYHNVCKDEWCRVHKTKVTFYFKQFRITRFQYQPKFESVEMFSYIGGYMGMWLGLSLISLFDFMESIAYLFYYPIGHLIWKYNKPKKIITNYETNAFINR